MPYPSPSWACSANLWPPGTRHKVPKAARTGALSPTPPTRRPAARLPDATAASTITGGRKPPWTRSRPASTPRWRRRVRTFQAGPPVCEAVAIPEPAKGHREGNRVGQVSDGKQPRQGQATVGRAQQPPCRSTNAFIDRSWAPMAAPILRSPAGLIKHPCPARPADGPAAGQQSCQSGIPAATLAEITQGPEPSSPTPPPGGADTSSCSLRTGPQSYRGRSANLRASSDRHRRCP